MFCFYLLLRIIAILVIEIQYIVEHLLCLDGWRLRVEGDGFEVVVYCHLPVAFFPVAVAEFVVFVCCHVWWVLVDGWWVVLGTSVLALRL